VTNTRRYHIDTAVSDCQCSGCEALRPQPNTRPEDVAARLAEWATYCGLDSHLSRNDWRSLLTLVRTLVGEETEACASLAYMMAKDAYLADNLMAVERISVEIRARAHTQEG